MRFISKENIQTVGKRAPVIISQAASSFATFSLNLYLLYMAAPKEFGLFGISFAAVMFITGFWQGYFITQYIVLAPEENANHFVSQVYTAMVVVALLSIGLLVGASVVFSLVGGNGFLVAGIGLTATAYSFKEFYIRYLFSVDNGWGAVLINLALVAALFALFAVSWIVDFTLTAVTALFGFSLTLVLVGVLGHSVAGVKLLERDRKEFYRTMVKLGVGGRWASATNIVYAIRNNAHVIILSTAIGALAVAQVNAARLFLTPVILLIPAVSNVILPKMASALSVGGHAALRSSQRQSATLLCIAILIYVAFLLLSWRFIEPLFVGDQYAGLFPLVVAWCAFAFARAIRSIFDWGAQAERRFALVAKISSGAAIGALAGVLIMTEAFGLYGAVVALTFAEFGMIVFFLIASKRLGPNRKYFGRKV